MNHCLELRILVTELSIADPKYSFFHKNFSSRSSAPGGKFDANY